MRARETLKSPEMEMEPSTSGGIDWADGVRLHRPHLSYRRHRWWTKQALVVGLAQGIGGGGGGAAWGVPDEGPLSSRRSSGRWPTMGQQQAVSGRAGDGRQRPVCAACVDCGLWTGGLWTLDCGLWWTGVSWVACCSPALAAQSVVAISILTV